MRLPKINLSRKKLRIITVILIALSIPVTLALIRVSQELRRRAAPPEIKTYRFTSDPESDGYLEKFKEGYTGFTCFGAHDDLLSESASAPQGLAQETVNVGSFCLPWGPFWMRRLFLSYDTSSIPEDETVVSAKICATIKSTSSSIVGPPVTISIYQYPWQTPGTLNSADWNERDENDFQNYLVEDLTEFPLVIDGTYYANVDPTRINKEGRTEYRLSAKTERMDGNTHYLPFYTGDATNEDFRPCLEVTTSTAPPPKAIIKGFKFEDIDGNQTQDSGEPEMADVTIILKDSTGTEISQTTTDDQGYFEFTELDPGDYIVEEMIPDGYENTTPTSAEVSELEGGQEREVVFGNRLIPLPEKGKISGYKWNDQNGNGVWDTGEPPYTESVVITLSGSSSQTDLTDETGYFEFDNLDPGDYTVEETPPDDWQPTTSTSVEITLTAGGDETANFGNTHTPPAKAKIHGHKFNDVNGNGSWDTASEAGIGKVVITLKDSEGTVLSSIETWEGTDLGYYLFEDLEPGDYIIEETIPEDFQPTTASSFEVTLASGNEKQIDFGNQEIGGGAQDPICQSLTAEPTSGTAPLTVSFAVSAIDSDGSIVFYEYDFGDGTSKETIPNSTTTHIYQTAGTYTASVRVQDDSEVWATSTSCQTSIDPTSPETPTHKLCQNSSCVTIDGEGKDECTTDTDCVTTPPEEPEEPAPTPPPAAPAEEQIGQEPAARAPQPPVPATAATAKTWTLIFSSLTLVALGVLTVL